MSGTTHDRRGSTSDWQHRAQLHLPVPESQRQRRGQELPVPIAGLRLDAPLGRRLGLTAYVEGGGLPRVSSGRQEGGTVYLSRQQAAAGLGLIYTPTPSVQLTAGYHLTYFFQHETSHGVTMPFSSSTTGSVWALTFASSSDELRARSAQTLGLTIPAELRLRNEKSGRPIGFAAAQHKGCGRSRMLGRQIEDRDAMELVEPRSRRSESLR
jgi:hypothetical protein